MKMNKEKIDNVVLAPLQLTLHDEFRAWKDQDFEVTNSLHEKGLEKSKDLFLAMFTK